MNAITQAEQVSHGTLEAVLGQGNLAELNPAQRLAYMTRTCESLGLNPLTRPFRFLTLNGQVQMYATRDCADQLRASRKISLTVVDKYIDGDLFCVTVRATTPDGRNDEDMGAVTLGQLKGEARANAIMKGITKAKRRVTLSICGLGFLDEIEAETLPHAQTFDAEAEIRQERTLPSTSMRSFVESGEINEPQARPSQAKIELQAAVLRGKAESPPPAEEETWIESVERRISAAPTSPDKIEVIGAIAAQEIKTEDDLTAMARSAPIKKLAETKDNLTRIQVFLAAARQRISKPKVPPLTGQFDIYDIDGHHIDGPFLHPIEFADKFTGFMGTVPVEDWTATLKVNEVDLTKAKKNNMAAKTLAKLESQA
jgi:hypothetical protein